MGNLFQRGGKFLCLFSRRLKSTPAEYQWEMQFLCIFLIWLIAIVGINFFMDGSMLKAVFFSTALLLTGCTASDFISATGEILNAKDSHDKNMRNERIKAANKAAGY